jgi:DNA-binding CsgD family transcriptional regulator
MDHGRQGSLPAGLPSEAGHSLAPYFSAWAARAPAALMLVTTDLKLVWLNVAAEALMQKSQHLTLREGVLNTVDTARTPALRSFLKASSEARTHWISVLEQAAPLIVSAQLLSAGEGPDLIGIGLHLTSPEDRYVWTDFGEALKLTRAETAVAKRILEGARAEIIAEEQGVSVETVRTHIRRMYGKLGVSGREQLFAIIAPFRL